MPYISPNFDAVIPDAVQSGLQDKVTILIVGAGPIGLALALDLGQRGHEIIVISRNTQLSEGSRALCYAKRPLEILDRLGIGEQMVDKGVSWNIGRVFFKGRKEPVYSFDLLPVKDQKMPAMINIQQYYNEEYNIKALDKHDNVEIRWGNQLKAVKQFDKGIIASVQTDLGDYKIQADWLIACDGASSPTRKMLKMGFDGETFQDNFLIADVKFKKEYPTERHFWFDPPFNPGQSVLLHKQPDDVWRIDFQVGWEIDREEIVKPENVSQRVKAIFGDDVEFEFEWISLYTFNCRQIEKMVQERVLFAGDSAHLVSPFGARGANTGFQDSDNLAWKLDLILQGKAGVNLLDSYNHERLHAAQINILNSTRSTDFITPKSKISKQFRDAVLQLSVEHNFSRGFVNSGRLSVPVPYPNSPLNTADEEIWDGGIKPGTNCVDGPLELRGQPQWLLNHLGWVFKLLVFVEQVQDTNIRQDFIEGFFFENVPLEVLFVGKQGLADNQLLLDAKGLIAERFDCENGGVYLIRPDQYVAARWKLYDERKVKKALCRAVAKNWAKYGK